jgi:hypothetical protein
MRPADIDRQVAFPYTPLPMQVRGGRRKEAFLFITSSTARLKAPSRTDENKGGNMKRLIVFFAFLSLILPADARAEEMTGRRIMELAKQRHDIKNDTADLVMLIIDKKGNKKERLIRRYIKKFGNGLTRSLIVFREPKDIEGTALLTWELDGGQSKQWLYLPGEKKIQRMASSSLKSYFMGTDLTYEDLMPDRIDDYTYTLTGEEKLDGQACYVIGIEHASKEKAKASGYSKRVVFIRKDILFAVKVDFYDQQGDLIKTQTAHDLEKLAGNAWTAKKVLITNHKKNQKTLLGVKNQRTDMVLDDAVFTEQFLLSGKYLP